MIVCGSNRWYMVLRSNLIIDDTLNLSHVDYFGTHIEILVSIKNLKNLSMKNSLIIIYIYIYIYIYNILNF